MAAVVESSTFSLTRARAIALLTELLEAFSRKTFQSKLGKLALKWKGTDGSGSGPIQHLYGRQALVAAAQRNVLPKYGFSIDEDGVLAMKAALRAYLGDPKVAELSRAARVQLRMPQMELPKAASPCVPSTEEADELSFLASPEFPEDSEPLAPTLLGSQAVVQQKVKDMAIKVTNPVDNRKMVVTMPRRSIISFPTVAEVKSAIAAHLGEGGGAKGTVDPSNFQLVIQLGGMYGSRRDDEIVKLDRVLALGVDIAAAAA